MLVEVQERQDAACLLVNNNLGPDIRHDLLEGLDIDAAPSYLRRLAVFSQQGIEAGDIALRFVDPFQAVAVCLAYTLVFLAFRQRYDLIIVAPGFVDQLLLLLLGLVDLIERLLNGLRRIDVFQLHLVNADPHLVLGGEVLHFRKRFDSIS